MAFGAFQSNASTAAPSSGALVTQRKSPIALLLLLPGVLYLILFFLTPLLSLVLTSFQAPVPGGFAGDYETAFQWQNYTVVLETYWPHISRSFVYALLATIFALMIGYPIAYVIGVKLREYPLWQALALVLVIAPFFISFLLRTIAWKQIFADEGILMSALKGLQVIPPDAYFTGTPAAVIFGLTYNFIPFMTLPIYTSLEKLDLRYLEAGGDLYAHPATVFWKITIPLSLPGILSGTLLTFIPAAGDYINASRDFLGSTDTQMIGNVIEANFLILQNFPAAALSLLLMAAILVLVTAYVKRSGTDEAAVRGFGKYALYVYAVITFSFLLIPIAYTVGFSFNDARRTNIIWRGFTFENWLTVCDAPNVCEALGNSILVAVVATALATTLGTMIAIALVRYRFRFRSATTLLLFLPMATPEVVLGAGLAAQFLTAGVEKGLVTVILAHTMFCVSFVVVTVRARVATLDPALEEAGRDLYASPAQVFWRITFPLLIPGIVAAALLSFALSFDDFIITNFNAGAAMTFPRYIYTAAARGIPAQANVIASAVFFFAIALVLMSQVGGAIRRRKLART